MARDERDDAYGGGAYGGGAYGGGDYGRGDRDARARDAHTHQNRAHDDFIARSRPTPTSTTAPTPETAPDASSASSFALHVGIHDENGDGTKMCCTSILEPISTPVAAASARRDVVPPPLETRLTPREWGGLLDAIHDARRRHPCYRCPAVERAAYLWGWPLCGLINSCNPLCCAVYCPYVSVVERCVARMNEEILHERGVDASFDRTFDLIVFDVVEDAPRWLRL